MFAHEEVAVALQTLGVCIEDNGGREGGLVDAEKGGGDVLHYIWYVLDVHASGSKFRLSSSVGLRRCIVLVVFSFFR